MVSSHSPLCEPCCSSTLELESCQLPRHGAKHIVGLQACLPCTCLLLTDFKALSPNYPHGHLTQQKYSCDRDRRAPCWSGGYGGGALISPLSKPDTLSLNCHAPPQTTPTFCHRHQSSLLLTSLDWSSRTGCLPTQAGGGSRT